MDADSGTPGRVTLRFPRRSVAAVLRLLSVPYHSGRHRVGMGNGPDRLLAAGAGWPRGSERLLETLAEIAPAS